MKKTIKSVDRQEAKRFANQAIQLEQQYKYLDAKVAWLKALSLCRVEAEYHCQFGIERCEFHMKKQRQLSCKLQQELAA